MKEKVVLAIGSLTLICLVGLALVSSWAPASVVHPLGSPVKMTEDHDGGGPGTPTVTDHADKPVWSRDSTIDTVLEMSKQNGTRFLYMIQTESCISDYLQEVIADPSVCPCDVLVLSYKQKCDKPSPPNVKYIYTKAKTSWGGGRNVLYEEAMKKEPIYLYYIIMDDDITIDREGTESMSNPWRRFEEFLVRVEPAASAIDIEDKLWLRRAANGRKNLGCSESIDAEASEYLSVARYDAAFNAFHNKTVRHILPYTSKFDNISWIFSPMYVNIMIELQYAGHSVLHNKIFATNRAHRSYPKHWPTPSEWQCIVDEAENKFPEKYRNSSLLMGWRKDGTPHEQKSPTLCLPPPRPKMPIRRFAYLDGLLPNNNIARVTA